MLSWTFPYQLMPLQTRALTDTNGAGELEAIAECSKNVRQTRWDSLSRRIVRICGRRLRVREFRVRGHERTENLVLLKGSRLILLSRSEQLLYEFHGVHVPVAEGERRIKAQQSGDLRRDPQSERGSSALHEDCRGKGRELISQRCAASVE